MDFMNKVIFLKTGRLWIGTKKKKAFPERQAKKNKKGENT